MTIARLTTAAAAAALAIGATAAYAQTAPATGSSPPTSAVTGNVGAAVNGSNVGVDSLVRATPATPATPASPATGTNARATPATPAAPATPSSRGAGADTSSAATQADKDAAVRAKPTPNTDGHVPAAGETIK